MRLRFLLDASLVCMLALLTLSAAPRQTAAADFSSGAHACAPAAKKTSCRKGDHIRAQQDVRKGDIVPLRQILAQVAADFSGDMIEARLEDHTGTPLYEIRLLAPDGTLYTLHYDAESMTLVKAQGRSLARWYKGDRQSLLHAVCPSARPQLLRDWEEAGQTPPEPFQPQETKWWQRLQDGGPSSRNAAKKPDASRKCAQNPQKPSCCRQKNAMEDHHACSRD